MESNARALADFVRSHFNTCSTCKGTICENLLLHLRTLSLDDIYLLIAKLGPHEKKYFEDKVLDILLAALSPPPATQNVNPEPPPQQGPMTRRRAANAQQQQQQQQQQPPPRQQQQRQQQPPRQPQQQPQPLHQPQQQQQPLHQPQPPPRQQQQRQQQPPRQPQQQPQPLHQPQQQQQPLHQPQPQPLHQPQQQQQPLHQPQPQPQPLHQPQQQQQPLHQPQQQQQPLHQPQPQPQPLHQQQQQPQPLHQQQQTIDESMNSPPSPIGAGSSSSILPIGWKCWRRLTKYLNANLFIVQVSSNGFIELSTDDRRPNDGARCTTEACKSLNVHYRLNNNTIVDDPRLGHHDTCKLKEADVIQTEQFERDFLLKVSATMVPPDMHEFEQQFTATFGAERFLDSYGTRKAQDNLKRRIGRANDSKVEPETAEIIFGKLDNFNPDDEEDVEEIESTDGQLNERMQNLTISAEAASSKSTTTTTTAASSSASASSAETSATSSFSTATTTAATTMSTKENNVDAETELREAVGTLCDFNEYVAKTFNFDEGKKLGEGGYSDVYQGILKRTQLATGVKIIPYRQGHLKTKFNDSLMASAAEILPEFLITKALSSLPGGNFLKLYDAAIVKGYYPQILLNLFDNYKGKKYNASPLKIDAENQTYLVLSLSLADQELEKVILKKAEELLSILAQVSFADAVAESVLEFEHRDQHVSNIFIQETEEPEISVELNGKTFGIKTFGKLARLADYGNSRLKLENTIICKDLEKENLVNEDAATDTDLHQQVYRQMIPILQNGGKDFTPKTSVIWLQYLIEKLTKYKGENGSQFSRKPPKTDVKLDSRKEISKELSNGVAVLPNAQEVSKYFESHKLFKGIITRKV